MKIKKVKIKQLLKLNLLRSKVYEHPIKKIKSGNLIDSSLNQIIVDIKKVLQIIFQYHQIEKRILFIGFPYKLEVKINQFTRHVAIPKSFEIQGMISGCNQKSSKSGKNLNQVWLQNSSKFLLPKLSKKPDLIILFEHDKSKTISAEAGVAKIPLISFGTSTKALDNVSYKVDGNFKNISTVSNKNVFFIGLNFLFKDSRQKSSRYF